MSIRVYNEGRTCLTVPSPRIDEGVSPLPIPNPTSSSTSTSTSATPSNPGAASSVSRSDTSASQRNKILLGVLIPLLIVLTTFAFALYLRCRRTRTRRRYDHVSIASPFLAPKSEAGNSPMVSAILKADGGTDPAAGGALTDAPSSVIPPSLPRKFRPAVTTRNAPESDHTSTISGSAPPSPTNANLSRQPSTAFSVPGVGAPHEMPSIVFASFPGHLPGQSSHHEQAIGAHTMQPLVFAPMSIQQLSGATGYPLLTAWPQAAGRRDEDNAPPAYASEAGSP